MYELFKSQLHIWNEQWAWQSRWKGKQGDEYLYKKSITGSSTCHCVADGATHMTTQIRVFTLGIFTTCCNTLNWKTALDEYQRGIRWDWRSILLIVKHTAYKEVQTLFTKCFPCVFSYFLEKKKKKLNLLTKIDERALDCEIRQAVQTISVYKSFNPS